MTLIARMVSKLIITRFFAILFGLTLFVLTLEVVSYAKEILALSPGNISIIATYIATRAPDTMATFLPMSLLLALLMAITELSYRNELTAIWAMGVSPLRFIGMLTPLALLAGTLQFALTDRAVPFTAPILREWAIADYGDKRIQIGENDPIWLRAGNDIMRAAKASRDSKQLEDVVIFRRDEKGLLVEQIFAPVAEFGTNGWLLSNAISYDVVKKVPLRSATLRYQGNMRPANAGSRSGDPEEMTIGDLSYFVANDGFGIRPGYVYQTWWHKRMTAFIVPLVMVALCVPLSTRFRRGGGLGVLFAMGVAFGFGFFVLDGIAMSMGEMGFVSPWLAAWLPVLLFSALGLYLVSQSQRV